MKFCCFSSICEDGQNENSLNKIIDEFNHSISKANHNKENSCCNTISNTNEFGENTGFGGRFRSNEMEGSSSKICTQLRAKTILSPVKPKKFGEKSKRINKQVDNRSALLARYLKTEDLNGKYSKFKSRENQIKGFKQNTKTLSSFGCKCRFGTVESSFKTCGSAESTSFLNSCTCKSTKNDNKQNNQINNTSINEKSINYMMIQKYRAHSSLFTVEEVNSNISSRSSIGKFMKDFTKSHIDMLSHNDNSILSKENRAS